ncbi:MAG TPA: response regulator [Thermoanaerobaculia bacterium]|nr:response regulator [Thermoanaerobaculia bacterium]
MPAAPRVLVVEDEDAIRALLVAALRREPFEVDAAGDGAAALLLTSVHEYAVIVLDLMMPRVSGFEFLEAFRRVAPQSRSVVIVVTAFDDGMVARLSADAVHAIVRKPFDVGQLVAIVREIAGTWSAHRQAAEKRSGGEDAAGPATEDAGAPLIQA